jgi:hypothetical protein
MSKDDTLFGEATKATKKLQQRLRKRDKKTKKNVKHTDDQTFEDIRKANKGA